MKENGNEHDMFASIKKYREQWCCCTEYLYDCDSTVGMRTHVITIQKPGVWGTSTTTFRKMYWPIWL